MNLETIAEKVQQLLQRHPEHAPRIHAAKSSPALVEGLHALPANHSKNALDIAAMSTVDPARFDEFHALSRDPALGGDPEAMKSARIAADLGKKLRVPESGKNTFGALEHFPTTDPDVHNALATGSFRVSGADAYNIASKVPEHLRGEVLRHAIFPEKLGNGFVVHAEKPVEDAAQAFRKANEFHQSEAKKASDADLKADTENPKPKPRTATDKAQEIIQKYEEGLDRDRAPGRTAEERAQFESEEPGEEYDAAETPGEYDPGHTHPEVILKRMKEMAEPTTAEKARFFAERPRATQKHYAEWLAARHADQIPELQRMMAEGFGNKDKAENYFRHGSALDKAGIITPKDIRSTIKPEHYGPAHSNAERMAGLANKFIVAPDSTGKSTLAPVLEQGQADVLHRFSPHDVVAVHIDTAPPTVNFLKGADLSEGSPIAADFHERLRNATEAQVPILTIHPNLRNLPDKSQMARTWGLHPSPENPHGTGFYRMMRTFGYSESKAMPGVWLPHHAIKGTEEAAVNALHGRSSIHPEVRDRKLADALDSVVLKFADDIMKTESEEGPAERLAAVMGGVFSKENAADMIQGLRGERTGLDKSSGLMKNSPKKIARITRNRLFDEVADRLGYEGDKRESFKREVKALLNEQEATFEKPKEKKLTGGTIELPPREEPLRIPEQPKPTGTPARQSVPVSLAAPVVADEPRKMGRRVRPDELEAAAARDAIERSPEQVEKRRAEARAWLEANPEHLDAEGTIHNAAPSAAEVEDHHTAEALAARQAEHQANFEATMRAWDEAIAQGKAQIEDTFKAQEAKIEAEKAQAQPRTAPKPKDGAQPQSQPKAAPGGSGGGKPPKPPAGGSASTPPSGKPMPSVKIPPASAAQLERGLGIAKSLEQFYTLAERHAPWLKGIFQTNNVRFDRLEGKASEWRAKYGHIIEDRFRKNPEAADRMRRAMLVGDRPQDIHKWFQWAVRDKARGTHAFNSWNALHDELHTVKASHGLYSNKAPFYIRRIFKNPDAAAEHMAQAIGVTMEDYRRLKENPAKMDQFIGQYVDSLNARLKTANKAEMTAPEAKAVIETLRDTLMNRAAVKDKTFSSASTMERTLPLAKIFEADPSFVKQYHDILPSMAIGWKGEMGKLKARRNILDLAKASGREITLPKDIEERNLLFRMATELHDGIPGGLMSEEHKDVYRFLNDPTKVLDGYFRRHMPDLDKKLAADLEQITKTQINSLDSAPGNSLAQDLIKASHLVTSASTGAIAHQILNLMSSAMHNGWAHTMEGMRQMSEHYGRGKEHSQFMHGIAESFMQNNNLALEALQGNEKSAAKFLREMSPVLSEPMKAVSGATMSIAERATELNWQERVQQNPADTLARIKREFAEPGQAERIMADLNNPAGRNNWHPETDAFIANRLDEIHPSSNLARSYAANQARGGLMSLFMVNKTRMIGILGQSYNMTIHQIAHGYKTGDMKMVEEGYKNMGKILVFLGVAGVAMGKIVDAVTGKPKQKKDSVAEDALGVLSQSYGVSPYVASAMFSGQAKSALTSLLAPPIVGPASDVVADAYGGIRYVTQDKDHPYRYRVFPGERTASHIPVIGGLTHRAFPHPFAVKEDDA